MFPVDMTVWEIPVNEAPDGILSEGYGARINNGVYRINRNLKVSGEQSSLLAEAERIIAPLSRALKYGMATEKEKADLETREKNRVRVSRGQTREDWLAKPN